MDIRKANYRLLLTTLMLVAGAHTSAREFHVSVDGSDTNDGNTAAMLKTISAAAQLAQPGDVITVHEGVYRERDQPAARGHLRRRSASSTRPRPAKRSSIKGSEVIEGLGESSEHDTWKVTHAQSRSSETSIPTSDLINGDWFNPNGPGPSHRRRLSQRPLADRGGPTLDACV